MHCQHHSSAMQEIPLPTAESKQRQVLADIIVLGQIIHYYTANSVLANKGLNMH